MLSTSIILGSLWVSVDDRIEASGSLPATCSVASPVARFCEGNVQSVSVRALKRNQPANPNKEMFFRGEVS